MRANQASIVVVALSLVSSLFTAPASAQIGALRRRGEEEARKRMEASLKKAAEDSAKKKAAADSAAKTKAPPSAQPATAAAPGPASTASQQASAKSDPKIWENYDFVPGSQVIFYSDFSEDRVGNFARGLKYKSGPGEVVERDGVKMLRATKRTEFLIPVGRRMPQRFTLEVDLIVPGTRAVEAISFEGGSQLARGPNSGNGAWNPLRATILGGGFDGATGTVEIPEAVQPALVGSVVHLRVLMDSAYFKMFVNERRIYNIPELQFKRDSVIRMAIDAQEENEAPLPIASIRVAESDTDELYDALSAKGRWATHGILFATGKADRQPESRSVLKEIAATLKQHSELKLLIEGHTDNVGAPASNLALSDARAAAVKAAVVSEYGIDGGWRRRLSATERARRRSPPHGRHCPPISMRR